MALHTSSGVQNGVGPNPSMWRWALWGAGHCGALGRGTEPNPYMQDQVEAVQDLESHSQPEGPDRGGIWSQDPITACGRAVAA